MDAIQAQRVIESLRKGIPPDGFVRHFTVGRMTEIDALEKKLSENTDGALLFKGDHGSGKTHLLRFIKETALEQSYAISFIVLDASSSVRFNRMDQILGTVIRNIEVPGKMNRGPSVLFEAVLDAMTSPCSDNHSKKVLNELSNLGRWDYSSTLKSPSLYIALRAWIIGSLNADKLSNIPQEVEVWLCEPWNYYSRTQWLYNSFVNGLRAYFQDSNACWQFYRKGNDTFLFNNSDYQQSWDALADLQLLARLSGLNGLIILVDEFEDVISGLKKENYQQKAYLNLFGFFFKKIDCLSFFAVTPSFVEKCQTYVDSLYGDSLIANLSPLKRLPTFEMAPLEITELESLAMKILRTHGIAYNWEPDLIIKESHLREIVRYAASCQQEQSLDRNVTIITSVVKELDKRLQGLE
jgi:hypothetical protein